MKKYSLYILTLGIFLVISLSFMKGDPEIIENPDIVISFKIDSINADGAIVYMAKMSYNKNSKYKEYFPTLIEDMCNTNQNTKSINYRK